MAPQLPDRARRPSGDQGRPAAAPHSRSRARGKASGYTTTTRGCDAWPRSSNAIVWCSFPPHQILRHSPNCIEFSSFEIHHPSTDHAGSSRGAHDRRRSEITARSGSTGRPPRTRPPRTHTSRTAVACRRSSWRRARPAARRRRSPARRVRSHRRFINRGSEYVSKPGME